MKIGISTACYYPLLTERALDRLAQLGIKYVEVFLNSFEEQGVGFAKELSAQARAAGIEILSVHPFTSMLETELIFGSYERRLADGLEIYSRLYECAAELGANKLVFHGAVAHLPIEQELYFSRYMSLHELGERLGVTLLQENIVRCQSREPDFLCAMRKYCDRIRFALDIKQARRAGYPVEAYVGAMGSAISHLHLSDGSYDEPDMDCMLVGEGSFDFIGFFNSIYSGGFSGTAVLELYRWGFSEDAQLQKSVDTLRAMDEYVLGEVGGGQNGKALL